jgi:glycosyltransferase involved in cell wall biosynthesis
MKVLVSAYACDPYRGSEPGVGWAAVSRIARKHDVYVLTDIHNAEGWERARAEGIIPGNVRVKMLRKRHFNCENRFIAHLLSWMNYFQFNSMVLEAAREWHGEIGFDLCHQVTIAAWRMPSPLWQLPIPLVWGPIGGAGYIPVKFRGMLSPAARWFEYFRDFNTWLALRSSALRDCLRRAAYVFAANKETEELLLRLRSGKPMMRLPIASISEEKRQSFRRGSRTPTGPLKLFAGGNIEGRKGVSLALRALARLANMGVDFRYTVAGGGPEMPALRRLCASLGLEDRVEFHPGYRGAEYIQALHESDVYFLPSFRESTPVTLLEAYLAGCYPVVADTSGQGEIVTLAGGHAVRVIDPEQLVEELAEALKWCHENRDILRAKVEASIEILSDYFSADRYDASLDAAYGEAMKGR